MWRLPALYLKVCNYDFEREWFEFKENWYRENELGEYVSALSNSAAIAGMKQALTYAKQKK
jgi:hypothetical protein